jgi:hypothetical protein
MFFSPSKQQILDKLFLFSDLKIFAQYLRLHPRDYIGVRDNLYNLFYLEWAPFQVLGHVTSQHSEIILDFASYFDVPTVALVLSVPTLSLSQNELPIAIQTHQVVSSVSLDTSRNAGNHSNTICTILLSSALLDSTLVRLTEYSLIERVVCCFRSIQLPRPLSFLFTTPALEFLGSNLARCPTGGRTTTPTTTPTTTSATRASVTRIYSKDFIPA